MSSVRFPASPRGAEDVVMTQSRLVSTIPHRKIWSGSIRYRSVRFGKLITAACVHLGLMTNIKVQPSIKIKWIRTSMMDVMVFAVLNTCRVASASEQVEI
jgi:hypothetical protein